MGEATVLEQLRHRIDVLPSSRRPGLNEATGGMDAQPLDVENGRRQKLGRERFRSQCVSALVASGSRPFDGRCRVEDGFRRPADRCCLASPNRLRLMRGFAEPAGGARFMKELLLALERDLVPVNGVLLSVTLCVANDLPVTLGEGRDGAFWDVEGDGGFAFGVKADPDPKRSQPVGEAGLKKAPYSWTLWELSALESIEPMRPSSVTTRFGIKLCR